MKIIRTFATEDGGSSMGELAVETAAADFVPGEPQFGVSRAESAIDVKYLQVHPGWYGGWHPTPRRQYLVVLAGGFEIETTDGQKQRFGIGDVVLLNDTEGKGHNTMMTSDDDTWVLAVALDRGHG